MRINPLILTSTLMCGTYYPISSSNRCNIKHHDIVKYAGCIFFNSSCDKPIQQMFPELDQYTNVNQFDFNLDLDTAINKLQMFTPSKTNYTLTFCSPNLIEIEFLSYQITIIGTPLGYRRSRLFVFSNTPKHKQIMFNYNLKIALTKLLFL